MTLLEQSPVPLSELVELRNGLRRFRAALTAAAP
jgi:hypothetical protein